MIENKENKTVKTTKILKILKLTSQFMWDQYMNIWWKKEICSKYWEIISAKFLSVS